MPGPQSLGEADTPAHRPPAKSVASGDHAANAAASILFLSGSGRGQLIEARPFPTCEKAIVPSAQVFTALFTEGELINGDLLYDNVVFVAFGRHVVPPDSDCLQGQGDWASSYHVKDFLQLIEAFIDAGVNNLIVSGFPERLFTKEAWSVLTDQGVDTHLAIPLIGIPSGHERKFEREPEIDIFFADAPCEEEEQMLVRMRRTLRQLPSEREDKVVEVLVARMGGLRKRFRELGVDGCRRLCRVAAHAHFQHGETVYSPGQVDDRCYVLLRGGVLLTVTNANGVEMVHLRGEVGVGGQFGELALRRAEPRTATAVTKAEGADVLVVTRGAYQEVRRQVRFEEVKGLLGKEAGARTGAELRGLLVFLGDTPQAFDPPPQLGGNVEFFRELEEEVRLALAARLLLRRCKAGEQLSVRGAASDGFSILMEGEVESQGQGGRLREGAGWGRTEVVNRTGKHSRSLTAATDLSLIHLSRHDYIAVTLRREEEDVENRFSVSNAFFQVGAADPEELARAFSLFSLTKYEAGELIASEGSGLECLWRGGEGQAGGAVEVERGGLHLDVVAKGRVVLERHVPLLRVTSDERARFRAHTAHPLSGPQPDPARPRGTPAGAKEVGVLELGRGELLSGPDLFGGGERWSCSARAASPVHLLSIPLSDAQPLLSRDRLRALQAAARAHAEARVVTLGGVLRCEEALSALPASPAPLAGLAALAAPLPLRAPRDRRRLLLRLHSLFPNASHLPDKPPPPRPATAPPHKPPRPPAPPRPTTARPAAHGGVEGGAGPGGQGKGRGGGGAGAGGQGLASPRPPQHPPPRPRPHTHREQGGAGGRASGLVGAGRALTAESPRRIAEEVGRQCIAEEVGRQRIAELAQPNPRTRRLPTSARLCPASHSGEGVAAGWCNRELPRYKGTVYLLKAQRGAARPHAEPYFSPWSLNNGSLLHHPQMRLDDILFAEVRAARWSAPSRPPPAKTEPSPETTPGRVEGGQRRGG